MARRRERILQEARRVITEEGFAALNLRALASAAQVTTPTIYNLIGNKEALIVTLFSGAMSEIEKRYESAERADPLQMTIASVIESINLFEEDPDYYRAAFMAVEYLDETEIYHETVSQMYGRGEQLIAAGVAACGREKLLRGRVVPEFLCNQIAKAYRTSFREWAFGQISVDEFRTDVLSYVYVTLAADAFDDFRSVLCEKLGVLNAPKGRADIADLEDYRGKANK